MNPSSLLLARTSPVASTSTYSTHIPSARPSDHIFQQDSSSSTTPLHSPTSINPPGNLYQLKLDTCRSSRTRIYQAISGNLVCSSLPQTQNITEISSDAYSHSADNIQSLTLSDADWKTRWPILPAFSDCDSEIFEGMH
ncbi:hypothetical protein DFH28DRAFT_1160011 [Melampsora americana]|nr:hypothetical protein DFH28DRAFT_1160011 [Melampsora americana]